MMMTLLKNRNPLKLKNMYFTRWVSDLDWRFLLILIPSLSLLVFLSLSSVTTSFNPLSSSSPLRSYLYNLTTTVHTPPPPSLVKPAAFNSSLSPPRLVPRDGESEESWRKREVLIQSRIAVCLVGGARRFELTGPSIVEKILEEYPNADLFLHSPLDGNSFKFSLLKIAPRIASIRIFQPKPIPETESQARVLTASGSPNGIQGLLQYFNLVEGCLTMIKLHQKEKNFTYDWIVRTRVDGYWNAPLDPESFVPGKYLVPPGSNFGGLNDRLGVGDFNTTNVALSRLSLVPKLDSAGFHQLNSETSFRAQLTTQGIPYVEKRLPFCIVTDRKYAFPPARYGVPVAAMSSPGPLSGAKCRPCKPVCEGNCVDEAIGLLQKGWSWTAGGNGTLQLCDAHDDWERGWEKVFDGAAGKKLTKARKRVWKLKVKECVSDFEEMRRRTTNWDAPPPEEICRLGL